MVETVAPRAGAWIETFIRMCLNRSKKVAPRAGAWIETAPQSLCAPTPPVAPRAGAWIETVIALIFYSFFASHPVRVRGLKR